MSNDKYVYIANMEDADNEIEAFVFWDEDTAEGFAKEGVYHGDYKRYTITCAQEMLT